MRRTRVFLAVVAMTVALFAMGLAGCGGSGSGGSAKNLHLPDFTQVFVADQDEAREYLESKFTVVEPENVVSPSAYYAFSSKQCAEACPSLDRATAEAAGDTLDMPGEWVLYGINPTNATLRLFGITANTTNEELVSMLDKACGLQMAMAYSQVRETGDAIDRTLWALSDDGTWYSIDSEGRYILNLSVSSMEAGWMTETMLAQRIADLRANPDSSLDDIYTLDNREQEQAEAEE